jgi:hypothetical protein
MKMFFARGWKNFKPGAGARLQCPTSFLRHRIILKKVFKKESYKTGSNRVTEEREGWCSDPHVPPCAGYVILPP